ncbi:MAG: hypothetical protein KBD63_02250 [Bacteriovoracaceae bacterium]|nr:hypothetical protein [Bacteriovoracaceae bacterium]
MFIAIAVETCKHPKHQNDYKVWYLETNAQDQVVSIGVKSKDEVIQSLFKSYQKTGSSIWKAMLKGSEKTTPIEAYDFISRNVNENTHFGNLPTLSEFQKTLQYLEMNLELRSIA